MEYVLLPIIIVVKCQYGPAQLHDSNKDHIVDQSINQNLFSEQ